MERKRDGFVALGDVAGANRAARRSPLGLDLYLWLVYRTFGLRTPVRLSWPQIYRQFGVNPTAASDKRTVQNLRAKVLRELVKIKSAWPELTYRTVRGGLVVSPSPPRVAATRLHLIESSARPRIPARSEPVTGVRVPEHNPTSSTSSPVWNVRTGAPATAQTDSEDADAGDGRQHLPSRPVTKRGKYLPSTARRGTRIASAHGQCQRLRRPPLRCGSEAIGAVRSPYGPSARPGRPPLRGRQASLGRGAKSNSARSWSRAPGTHRGPS